MEVPANLGPPQCPPTDPSHQGLLQYISCHLTPFSLEQVLRVPVPPNVAFELGKERWGLGIREGLWQGQASLETHGMEAMIQSFIPDGGSTGKY